MSYLNNKKGSVTIEAAIILPFIMFFILSFIILGFLMSQRSLTKVVADLACEKASQIWYSDSKDILMNYLTYDDIENFNLYESIYDKNKNDKKNLIKSYVYYKLEKLNAIKPTNRDYNTADFQTENLTNKSAIVEVNVRTEFVFKKRIEITITRKLKNPIGRYLKSFGVNEYIIITTTSSKSINSPVEFIRNTDLAFDTYKQYKTQYGGVISTLKIGESITKTKDVILNVFSENEDVSK